MRFLQSEKFSVFRLGATLLAVILSACSTDNHGRFEANDKTGVAGRIRLGDVQDLSFVEVALTNGTIIARSKANADGTFLITRVLPGNYEFLASAGDHTTEKVVKRSVAIAQDQIVDLGEIGLTPTGNISGRVAVSTGESPFGVIVFVPGTSFMAVAGNDGKFLISGVPAGSHDVVTYRAGASSSGKEGVEVVFAETTDVGTLAIEILPGAAGLSCWDLNENGMPDASEDVNDDNNIDVLDCRGPAGSNGSNGFHCWDTNQNGVADFPGEDRNGDSVVNVADCQGEGSGEYFRILSIAPEIVYEDTNGQYQVSVTRNVGSSVQYFAMVDYDASDCGYDMDMSPVAYVSKTGLLQTGPIPTFGLPDQVLCHYRALVVAASPEGYSAAQIVEFDVVGVNDPMHAVIFAEEYSGDYYGRTTPAGLIAVPVGNNVNIDGWPSDVLGAAFEIFTEWTGMSTATHLRAIFFDEELDYTDDLDELEFDFQLVSVPEGSASSLYFGESLTLAIDIEGSYTLQIALGDGEYWAPVVITISTDLQAQLLVCEMPSNGGIVDPMNEINFPCCQDHGEYYDYFGQSIPAANQRWSGLFERVEPAVSMRTLHVHTGANVEWYEDGGILANPIGNIPDYADGYNLPPFTPADTFGLVWTTNYDVGPLFSQAEENISGQKYAWLYSTNQPNVWVVVLAAEDCSPGDGCLGLGAAVIIRGVQPIIVNDLSARSSDVAFIFNQGVILEELYVRGSESGYTYENDDVGYECTQSASCTLLVDLPPSSENVLVEWYGYGWATDVYNSGTAELAVYDDPRCKISFFEFDYGEY